MLNVQHFVNSLACSRLLVLVRFAQDDTTQAIMTMTSTTLSNSYYVVVTRAVVLKNF